MDTYSKAENDFILSEAWMQNGESPNDPILIGTSQVAPVVKNLPTNAADARDAGSILGSVRSPGEGKAPHSSIVAWRSP